MRTITTSILALWLVGCAGQNVYVPVPTSGRDRNGNPTTGVKAVPVFKNTGNLAKADFAYSGAAGTVRFNADLVDNATATAALHEGTSKTVRSVGSVIGTALAGWAGIAAVTGAANASIAESNANSAASVAASQASTRQAAIAARSGVASEAIAAKAGVVGQRIGADAATKALRIDAIKAIRLK